MPSPKKLKVASWGLQIADSEKWRGVAWVSLITHSSTPRVANELAVVDP